MKRRFKLWAAVLAAAFVALTLETGRERDRVAAPSPVPSVDNPAAQGLEAAYLYLAGRGRAQVLAEPFSEIPGDVRVLITAQPYARPVGSAEQSSLLEWVSRGGTLVVLGAHAPELDALAGVLEPRSVALHLNGRDIGLAELGRDLRSLIRSAKKSEHLELVPARAAVADPLLAGVHALAVSPDRGFDADPGEAVPLLLAGDTPVALSLARGRGRILALAGPDAFTNARIDLGDNLQLLANLAALGPLAFDEYHHRPGEGVALAAFARAFGPPLAAALVCALLLALAVGRRLGPVVVGELAAPRTARDYAGQLGQMYRRAGAERALAADLAAELRDEALRRTHLSPHASAAQLAQALSLSDADAARRFAALCAELEGAGALSPSRYARLSRAALQWKLGR